MALILISVGLWKKTFPGAGAEIFAGDSAKEDYERRIGELEHLPGKKGVEIAFLKASRAVHHEHHAEDHAGPDGGTEVRSEADLGGRGVVPSDLVLLPTPAADLCGEVPGSV